MAGSSGAGQSLGSEPVTDAADGKGSRRVRLRRAAVLVLSLLGAAWALIAIRLEFLPPAGLSDSLSGVIGWIAAANAVAYEFGAYWVGGQKRWGHIVAIVLVAVQLVFGVTAGMTWLEWTFLGANVAALGLLFACVPPRRR